MDNKYFYFNTDEIHHLYYGMALMIIGAWFNVEWLIWIGYTVALDDAYQHYYQGVVKHTYANLVSRFDKRWLVQSPMARLLNDLVYSKDWWKNLATKFKFLKNGN
jgi:hypothetical protein